MFFLTPNHNFAIATDLPTPEPRSGFSMPQNTQNKQMEGYEIFYFLILTFLSHYQVGPTAGR